MNHKTTTKNIESQNRMTRREIAEAVIMFRKLANWKQLALAFEAGVNERTIQRVEKGERVDDKTLRSIAHAFGFAEEAFLGWYRLVDVRPLSSHGECDQLLMAHACNIDDSLVDPSVAIALGLMRNEIEEWMEEYPNVAGQRRSEIRRDLLAEIRGIESRGYVARLGTYVVKGQLGEATLVFIAKDNRRLCALKRMMLPSPNLAFA